MRRFLTWFEYGLIDMCLVCAPGHSMGGLDARQLVYLDEYINGIKGSKYQVRSITTIGTPHRGSPVAEWSNALGQ